MGSPRSPPRRMRAGAARLDALRAIGNDARRAAGFQLRRPAIAMRSPVGLTHPAAATRPLPIGQVYLTTSKGRFTVGL